MIVGQEIPSAHSGSVACLAISSDGTKLISAGGDGVVKVWAKNAESNEFEFKSHIQAHGDYISAIRITDDGEYLLTASWDATWKLFNISSQAELCKCTLDKELTSIAISPDSRTIYVGQIDGTICVCNTLGETKHVIERAHSAAVTDIAFLPNSNMSNAAMSTSKDHTLKIWDLQKSGTEALKTLSTDELNGEGNGFAVSSFAVSPDASLAAAGSVNGAVSLYDINGGSLLSTVCQRTADETPAIVNKIAFSPNRYWVIAARHDSVRIDDLESKSLLAQYTPPGGEAAMSLAVVEDDIWVGFSDGTIRRLTVQ